MKILPPSVEKLKAVLELSGDEALLSKIQQQFGGALAFFAFKFFLDQHDVEYEYFQWN